MSTSNVVAMVSDCSCNICITIGAEMEAMAFGDPRTMLRMTLNII
jgi:hypothetical protein